MSATLVLPAPSAEPPRSDGSFRHRIESSRPVSGLLSYYRRHERYAPAAFFFGGVAWDASTLRRIDAIFDNVFIAAYLLLAGGLILLATLIEHGKVARPAWLLKHREWYPAGIQFLLGALFSAYVIYYFQSASLSQTSFFLVLLVGLLVLNEFIHKRLLSLYLLLALYFLAVASFFIFFVPIVTHSLGRGTFILSTVLSLLVPAGMIYLLRRWGVLAGGKQVAAASSGVLALFALLHLFYAFNWIPPVPLSLRHGGVYHAVERDGNGYRLTFEQPPWYRFWADSDGVFRLAEGEPVYCFAAVFAPTQLRTPVFHEWRAFDETRREWVLTDRIQYRVVGGRDGGFRGHTLKRNVHAGRWRVDVQAEDGRTIGRIRFRVEAADSPASAFRTITY